MHFQKLDFLTFNKYPSFYFSVNTFATTLWQPLCPLAAAPPVSRSRPPPVSPVDYFWLSFSTSLRLEEASDTLSLWLGTNYWQLLTTHHLADHGGVNTKRLRVGGRRIRLGRWWGREGHSCVKKHNLPKKKIVFCLAVPSQASGPSTRWQTQRKNKLNVFFWSAETGSESVSSLVDYFPPFNSKTVPRPA